jgi:hypothetical protein
VRDSIYPLSLHCKLGNILTNIGVLLELKFSIILYLRYFRQIKALKIGLLRQLLYFTLLFLLTVLVWHRRSRRQLLLGRMRAIITLVSFGLIVLEFIVQNLNLPLLDFVLVDDSLFLLKL